MYKNTYIKNQQTLNQRKRVTSSRLHSILKLLGSVIRIKLATRPSFLYRICLVKGESKENTNLFDNWSQFNFYLPIILIIFEKFYENLKKETNKTFSPSLMGQNLYIRMLNYPERRRRTQWIPKSKCLKRLIHVFPERRITLKENIENTDKFHTISVCVCSSFYPSNCNIYVLG